MLGELLIFKRMRSDTLVPTVGGSLLSERHVRILWATWHIVSIFGLGFAAILGIGLDAVDPPQFVQRVIAVTMAVSGSLVLVATKAKHPGWIGLLLVAALAWIA